MIKRFGKLHLFISLGTALSSLLAAYCYHVISDWSMIHYQRDYGFIVLLVLELILNLTALSLVCQLPKLPAVAHPQRSLKNICIQLSKIISWVTQNQRICYHIILAGILEATTFVFVWSFQPMMKLLTLPVAVYGVVYFMNHFCRAFFSCKTESIMHRISLARLSIVSVSLFVLGFLFSLLIIYIQPIPVYVSLTYFFFLSVVIGFQLAFSIANTSRLHHIVPPDIRATIASYNKTIARLCTGGILIVLKFLVDGLSLQVSLGICLVIFLLTILPLKKVYAISSKEKHMV